MPGSTDAVLVSEVRQLPILAKHFLHELAERIGILSSKRFVAIHAPSMSYSQPTPQGSTGLHMPFCGIKRMPRTPCRTASVMRLLICDRLKADRHFPHG